MQNCKSQVKKKLKKVINRLASVYYKENNTLSMESFLIKKR